MVKWSGGKFAAVQSSAVFAAGEAGTQKSRVADAGKDGQIDDFGDRGVGFGGGVHRRAGRGVYISFNLSGKITRPILIYELSE